MIVATHQPLLLPWPGLFFKALKADVLVFLDDVQFPTGSSFLTRNRIKDEDGELWLIVPVWRKGLGLQQIRDVEICHQRNWGRKHLTAIRQNYANAPYLNEYMTGLEETYRRDHTLLADLNLEIILFLTEALDIDTPYLLQTELGVKSAGTELIIDICRETGADRFLNFPAAAGHLDTEAMRKEGIEFIPARYSPPVYPQLHGEFIYNLSTLDLLMNCGPASREIILEAGG